VLLLLGALTDSSRPAVVGAVFAIVAMVGALATHGRLGDPPARMAPAGVLLVLGAVVVATA